MFCARRNTTQITRILPVSAFGAILCFGLTIGEARADNACGALPGTYLVTVSNSDGSFASRQVVTLTEDGNVIVSNSGQGGETGVFNPFTSEQGTWECQSHYPPIQAHAITLDFSLPGSVSGPQQIGRGDYQITFSLTSKTISGTIDLRFFPLTGNPLVSPLPAPASTYTFTGVRVTS